MKEHTFLHDHRESNPGLHMLHVKTAIMHLRAIDKTIKQFNEFANLNMMPVLAALLREREILVRENAAYFDADQIVRIYRTGKCVEPAISAPPLVKTFRVTDPNTSDGEDSMDMEAMNEMEAIGKVAHQVHGMYAKEIIP